MSRELNKILDVEGEIEYNDENSLEMRLFLFMFKTGGSNGFRFTSKSKVTSLYLDEREICRLDENKHMLYFLRNYNYDSNVFSKEFIENLNSLKEESLYSGYILAANLE